MWCDCAPHRVLGSLESREGGWHWLRGGTNRFPRRPPERAPDKAGLWLREPEALGTGAVIGSRGSGGSEGTSGQGPHIKPDWYLSVSRDREDSRVSQLVCHFLETLRTDAKGHQRLGLQQLHPGSPMTRCCGSPGREQSLTWWALRRRRSESGSKQLGVLQIGGWILRSQDVELRAEG